MMRGGAGNNQSYLLRIRNFLGLSAGTADDLLDVIFSVRGVVCSSKGYMSRLCWPIPDRHAQALKKYQCASLNIFLIHNTFRNTSKNIYCLNLSIWYQFVWKYAWSFSKLRILTPWIENHTPIIHKCFKKKRKRI